MADIIAIKEYFAKLQREIDQNAEFIFLSYRIVKKSHIDDILCCILALFPDYYKRELKNLKQKNSERLPSVSAFSRLEQMLKTRLPFCSDLYIVAYSEALSLIRTVTVNMERDFSRIEHTLT